jgi:hypothetical protein
VRPFRFAVHLTRLNDFSALNAGRPHIEMTPESGGSPATVPGSEPLRPGAFRVEGKIPAAGRYRWALIVDAPGLSDRHDLGTATVFPDQPSAIADAEKRPPDDPTAMRTSRSSNGRIRSRPRWSLRRSCAARSACRRRSSR